MYATSSLYACVRTCMYVSRNTSQRLRQRHFHIFVFACACACARVRGRVRACRCFCARAHDVALDPAWQESEAEADEAKP